MKSPEERLRKFEEVVETVRKVETVLVEGKEDRKALRKLGVETEVITVKGNGKSLLKNAEEISRKTETEEVVVLTDWDSEGDKICSKLKDLLQLHGILPRTSERSKLRGLTSKQVHEVEALTSWKKRMKKKVIGDKKKNGKRHRKRRQNENIPIDTEKTNLGNY